jgi:hypothetical protein
VAEATKLSEVVASSRHRGKNVAGLHVSFTTALSNDLRFSLELEGVQEDIPDVASELRTRIGALGNQTTQR